VLKSLSKKKHVSGSEEFDCLLGSEDETQNGKKDFMGDFTIHVNSTV